MLINILLWNSVTIVAASLCLNGSECPHNQPFCTPVGCVFRCPSNVFINGSNCVEDCGKYFINNRTCVPKCLADHFVRQVIVSAGLQFHKHNFCEKSCPKETFIFERHCLEECPENANYLLNNTCVDTCAVSQPFRRNIRKDNALVAVECRINCSGDYPVSYGKFCLDMCRQPLFQYTNECVKQCPNNASLIYKQGDVLHCTKTCPDKEKILNGTCLSTCPSHYKVYHRRCVTICPKGAPYTYSDWTDETRCVEKCPSSHEYVNNTECVSFCPEKKYIMEVPKMCVDKCPSSHPYVGFSKTCVTKCGSYQHPVNGTCIYGDACEDQGSTTYAGGLCVGYCPKGQLFIFGSCYTISFFRVLAVTLLLLSMIWIAFGFQIFTNCLQKLYRKCATKIPQSSDDGDDLLINVDSEEPNDTAILNDSVIA